MFITPQEVLMGRDQEFPLSDELKQNLDKLLIALNKFRAFYGKPMIVSSGYRPGRFNVTAGGAKQSNHEICLACDFKDLDGSLDQWCLDHPEILENCGLYQEHPDSTPKWLHLQLKAPKSGNRVFRP